MIARRSFLTGLGALLAAPAIVHAGNIMPVKMMLSTRPPSEFELELIEAAKQLGARDYNVETLRMSANEWVESAIKYRSQKLVIPSGDIVRYPDFPRFAVEPSRVSH